MRKGKPTFEEIKTDLLPKCEKIYNDLWGKFDEDERFYELDFEADLNIPSEFVNDGIVLPTARDVVDVFVDHIDISNARVYVNRKGTSEISAEEVEMMRKFYLGLIHRTNVESDISPWRVAAKHYALYGVCILKSVWDADRWPDKPIQGEKESEDEYAERIDEWRHETHQSIPIVIQAINPRCIMPDPSYGGRMFVIEKHKNLVMDISKRWPNWSNPNNKKVNDEVEYISYWDADYRCDFVDGEPVLGVRGGVGKHNYGFIPYVIMDSGLGNVSSDAKPEKRYVGILRYITDLLISESLNYSLCNILMKRETLKGGYITGTDAGNLPKVSQEYGFYWPVGNKDVQFHDWETKLAPQAAYAHLGLTADYIAAHAAPRAVRGLSEEGVRSGADRRLIMEAASARYQYSEDAFRNGTAKVLTNCARLFKNVIPGDIRVWAKTPSDEFDVIIKKEKMKEPFTCYVEFAPISEEDEYRRHDDLERLMSAGIVTKRWSRQQMSNVDALAMEREERKELLRQSPGYLQVINDYLGTRMQEALQELGQGTIPPMGQPTITGAPIQGGGTPGLTPVRAFQPAPQRAPLGSAEEIQQRLKQLRSQTPIQPMQGQGGGGQR